MRVIAGKFGGTRLEAVKGNQTRPTTDKIKEAMFSILLPYLGGGLVLDLYAGTGGLGIEAVSRGMDHAVLVDRQYAAIQVITRNVDKTHASNQFTVMKAAAKQALQQLHAKGERFDLLLFDPPYAKEEIAQNFTSLVDLGLLNDGAILMVESDQGAKLPTSDPDFELVSQKHYGITVLTVYRYQGKQESV